MEKFGGDLGAIEASLADLRKTRMLAQRGFVSSDDVNVLASNRPGSKGFPTTATQKNPTPAAVASAYEEVGMTPGTTEPPPSNAIATAPVKSGGRDATGVADLNANPDTAAGTTGKTVQRQMASGGAQSKPTPSEQQGTTPPQTKQRSVLFSRMEEI